jgi:tetratricopeptide (TPR) repeat protein
LPDHCQPESITAQLDRILTSSLLASSPSLCRFLRYIVEETLAGRSAGLKEYSLGVQVFGRGDNFNPRLDPIVRVQARNLRARVARYYAGPGVDDPIAIDLPKGSYVPVFRGLVAVEQLPVVAAPPIPPPEVRPQSPHRIRLAIAVAAVFAVIAGIAALWIARTHAASRFRHQPDSLAQDLYIRGRYVMDRQTESALRESITSFQQAAARDPQFAAAHAGLADAYDLLSQLGYIPPRDGMEKARRAAEQSLSIDPKLAEGHVSRAAILEAYDWNWGEAEREYRRALELNPGLPAAHLWYGMFLRDQGRLKEALPELRRAAELEPFSLMTSVNLAYGLMAEGNYSAALEQARHASELAPNSPCADVILSHAYQAASQTKDSEAVLAHAVQNVGENPHGLAMLAGEYMRHGKREESQRLFHQLERLSNQRYVSPFDMGSVALMLGEEDRALGLFEEAYRQRSSGLIFLRNANVSRVRDSTRFNSLLDKLHFKS